ncbi:hypothetical protein BC826DRAFT_727466 [Russula brevipes]|nr:hypothetical protein BC826DRAFT_727466 [Russula brevipes]
MVQGSTKGLQTRANNNARHAHKAAANTKKGHRRAAPKKAIAIKQASMHKRQDQQVRRTTDGERRIIGKAHDYEKRRHGERQRPCRQVKKKKQSVMPDRRPHRRCFPLDLTDCERNTRRQYGKERARARTHTYTRACFAFFNRNSFWREEREVQKKRNGLLN